MGIFSECNNLYRSLMLVEERKKMLIDEPEEMRSPKYAIKEGSYIEENRIVKLDTRLLEVDLIITYGEGYSVVVWVAKSILRPTITGSMPFWSYQCIADIRYIKEYRKAIKLYDMFYKIYEEQFEVEEKKEDDINR